MATRDLLSIPQAKSVSLLIIKSYFLSASSMKSQPGSNNPNVLTARSLFLAEETLQPKCWFAVFSASNNEKQVEQHLRRKDIETFLPLYSVKRRWKNRTTVQVELPLFPSYVFARFARNQSVSVLEVPRVYSIVSNRNGAVALPDSQIELLRSGLVPTEVEPHPYVAVGQRARIREGALSGLVGFVTRVDDAVRVVLSVESVMRSVAVRVTLDNLELLDDDVPQLSPT